MAAHKLNVLHWHLTDNQGWRLPVEKHPALVAAGSVRPVSGNKRDLVDLAKTGVYGPYPYTQGDIAEIIDYAAKRFIRTAPVFSPPG